MNAMPTSLSKTEKRYKFLIENIADCLYEFEGEGRITYVSPQIYSILGYEPEEIIGENLSDYVHESDLPNVLDSISKVSITGGTLTSEFKMIHKNGSSIDVSVNGEMELYNRSRKFIGILSDISERKIKERLLIESERKFRLLYENAPLPYQSLDEKAFILEVNKSWLNFFGYRKEEVIGKWLGDFMVPSCQDFLKVKFPQFKEGGSIQNVQYEVIRKDGEHRIISFNGAIGYDEKGNFERTHCIFQDLTERVRYTQRLRDSEEKYRTLSDYSMVGISIIQDNQFKYVNQKLAVILGYTTEELLKLKPNELYTKLIHPEDLEEAINISKRNQEGENPRAAAYLEFQALKKNGDSIWLETFARSIQFKGRPAGMNVSIDITERKKAKEKLIESEEKFRIMTKKSEEMEDKQKLQAFDITERIKTEIKIREREKLLLYVQEIFGLGYWDLNIVTGELYWSDETFRIYGFKSQEFVPTYEKFRNIVHPEDIEYVQRHVDSALQNNIKYSIDFRFVRPNGEIRFIYSQGDVTRDEEGKAIRFVGTQIDITERKKLEEKLRMNEGLLKEWNKNLENEIEIRTLELRQSEEKFRILAEQSLMGIGIAQENKFIYINKAFSEIFGYTIEEMLSLELKDVVDAIHPDDRAFAIEQWKKKQKGEEDIVVHYEYRGIKKSGEIIWIENYSKPIIFENKPANFITLIDITERKKLEEKLRKLNKKLEEKIEERTATLRERVKELTCLYKLSQLAEKVDISVENLLSESLDLIPPALQYPRITGARIIYKGQQFQTKNFDETNWNLSAELKVKNKIEGSLIVCYLEEKPIFDIGPFLNEENDLIYGIAEILGRFIERKNANQELKTLNQNLEIKIEERTQKLKESEEKYRTLSDYSMVGISIIQDNQFKYANQKLADNIGYTIEELLNIKQNDLYTKLIHPQDLEEALKIKKRNQEGKNPQAAEHMELHGLKKNGTSIWLEIFARSIQFEGRPAAMNVSNDITERKKAEQKLKESEEKFRMIFNNANDAIAIINLEGKIIECNETMSERLGYTKEELLHMSPINFDSPKYANGVLDRIEEVRQNGESFHEVEHLRKDGLLIPTEINSKLIDFQGKPAILSIARDITTRKKAEQKLRESKERFQKIYETVPDLYFLVDEKGTHLDFKGSKNLLYLTPEMFLGKTIHETLPKDVADKYYKAIITTLKTKTSTEIEYSLQINKIPHVYEARVLYFSTNQAAIFVRDISKKKLAEQNLKESEERFRILAEQSLMGIGIAQENKLIYINKAFSEMLGYTTKEILSWELKDIVDAIHPDDRAFTLDQFDKKQQGGGDIFKVNNFEYRGIKKSGEIIWLENYSKPIIFEDKTANFITIIDISERKKVEKKLKESERSYRELFENSPIALFEQNFSKLKSYVDNLRVSGINDFENFFDENPEEIKNFPFMINLVDVNKKVVELYHAKTKENFIKRKRQVEKNISKYMTPEVLLTNKREILSLINGNTTFESEAVTKTFTGEEINVYMKTLVIPGYENDWSKVIVSLLDITDRIKAEKELKESEERFRSTFEQAAIGIAHSALDGTFLRVNQGLCDIVKYSREELYSLTFQDITHPDDIDSDLDHVSQLFNNEIQSFMMEKRYICKDKSSVWVNLTGSLVRKPSGEPNYLIAVIEDITERKLAEQKLRESEEKVRNLINNISDVLIELNIDGVLTFSSPQIFRLIESPSEEIINSKLFELLHPEDRDFYQETFQAALILKAPLFLECKIRHKKGYFLPISIRGGFVEINNMIKFFGIIRDITERKQIENMIKKEMKTLRGLDKIRNDLVTRMSHELKTPLISIFSGTEFLLHDYSNQLPEDVKIIISDIHNGGYRLKTMVENLLTVFEIDSEQIKFNPTKENIIKIIKQCIEGLIYFANERNLSINVELLDSLILNVDKDLIRKAIFNIISNAVKNTPSNGNIYISTVEHHNYIELIIKDTGVGITKKERVDLFRPFGKIERYGKGLDVDIEGPGLGLYITSEIVKLHEGELELKSKGRNKGTTCIIRLNQTS